MKELLARLFSRPVIAFELIVASLFANLLALATPMFVIQVLNRYIAYGVDSTLATLTAGVVIAIVLEFGFRQVRLRLAGAVNARFDEAQASGAFDVLTGAKAAAMDMLPPGLRREVIKGAETVQAAYNAPNVAAVLDVPFALVFVGALFLLSPLLAAIAVGFLSVIFVAVMVNQLSLRQPTRQLTAVSGRCGTLVDSAIVAADTVRAFNSSGFLRRLWRGETRTLDGLRRRIVARQGLLLSLTQSSQALMSVAIIAIGATLAVKGDLSVGALIGANILAARALGPISRLAGLTGQFARARQSLNMFREFAKLPQERMQGSALSEYKGGLEFKDLAFAFPGSNAPLFESLSMKLEPGAILVVNGANGAGKTTLARLLLGLLEPTRGQILVDGVDLAQVVPEWWRRQVVYLPQEPRFLNATLRENLLAFNPELDDGGLNGLVRAAGLRSFIDHNPAGFDAPVVNQGDNLSLGHRRRLALARGLATDGMLVVVDEPTEGLDGEGSAKVYAVMNELAKRGRTIIAFSHDPNIIMGARFVLDLDSKPVPKLKETRPADPTPAIQATAAQAHVQSGSYRTAQGTARGQPKGDPK